MKNINGEVDDNSIEVTSTTHTQIDTLSYNATSSQNGLADLQRSTTDALSQATQWGFSNTDLKIKRHKLDDQTWRLTVVNPKTSKTILQAEGHGDTVFAHEKNLASMAEILIAQGLTIRTHFDD